MTMYEHWPSCGNGWLVIKNPTRDWEIMCSGECHCPWVIDDSTSVAFHLPRPLRASHSHTRPVPMH